MPKLGYFDQLAPSRLVAWALALVMALAPGFAPVPPALADGPPASGTVTTRLDFNLNGIEEGLGAGQRGDLSRVGGLLLEGKIAVAEQLIDKALASFDQQMVDAHVDYVCVADRGQLNRYQKEHPSTRKLIWLDWGYGYALLMKGFIASTQKRWKEAATWLEKSVQMRPYSANGHIERGYVFNMVGRHDDAVKSYETAVGLARTYPTEKGSEPAALRGLSFALIELKDMPKARKALQDSLRLEPTNRLARSELKYVRDGERKRVMQNLGDLFQQARWADVATKLGQQVAAEPANAAARVLRADARAELGHWQQAVEDLEAAITLDDGNPLTWYSLTVARLGAGQDKEYRRACERMVQRFGIDFDASSFVIRACRAVPDALTEPTTVLVMAEARQKSQPGAADALTDLGALLYRAGRFGEAVQRLDEALKLRKAGDFATFFDLVFLAMAHQRLHHQDEARRALSGARNVLSQTRTTGAKPLPWYSRVTAQRLQKEAEALLNPEPARPEP